MDSNNATRRGNRRQSYVQVDSVEGEDVTATSSQQQPPRTRADAKVSNMEIVMRLTEDLAISERSRRSAEQVRDKLQEEMNTIAVRLYEKLISLLENEVAEKKNKIVYLEEKLASSNEKLEEEKKKAEESKRLQVLQKEQADKKIKALKDKLNKAEQRINSLTMEKDQQEMESSLEPEGGAQ